MERRFETERRGLWAGGLQGGELGEINRWRGRKRVDDRDREWQRRGRRTRESICYNVLGAREVEEVAGKLKMKDSCLY